MHYFTRTRFSTILLLMLLAACSDTPVPFRSTVIPEVKWGKNFSLTSQQGTTFDTATLHGKVQVIFFGFTHCPDICTPTLTKLAQVNKALGDERPQVQVVFVTVDPQHDTPRQLASFLAGIDASFIGLTGSPEQLKAVAQDHKIYAEGAGGMFTHSGNLLVKDRSGRVRLVIAESASVEDIVHDLRLLLTQK